MEPSLHGGQELVAAACIAEICAVLQSAEADERVRLAARAASGARRLDARLQQIQASLERIEARLGEVEQELGELTRPSWPF